MSQLNSAASTRQRGAGNLPRLLIELDHSWRSGYLLFDDVPAGSYDRAFAAIILPGKSELGICLLLVHPRQPATNTHGSLSLPYSLSNRSSSSFTAIS